MLAEVSEALVAVGSAVGGPLVVAGHSAGAQLVAMTTLAHPSAADVRRCVLVSGVFDLRELPGTSMNDALRLDAERAAALSPLVAGVRVTSIPVELWWGDRDTPRFAEMSRDYGALLAAGGCQVDLREFAGTHHFDIVDRLTELTTAP
jgi:pimeloyl-ACP methyl ester carboxylesterase